MKYELRYPGQNGDSKIVESSHEEECVERHVKMFSFIFYLVVGMDHLAHYKARFTDLYFLSFFNVSVLDLNTCGH